jgi:hypothetical protein
MMMMMTTTTTTTMMMKFYILLSLKLPVHNLHSCHHIIKETKQKMSVSFQSGVRNEKTNVSERQF